MSYSSNHSIVSKSRQALVKDEKLAQAINRIVTTGQGNEDYKQFDGWKREALQGLNDAALENRIDTALESLAKLHPQLATYIATEDQDQTAEDQDQRTRIDQRGKRVFITMSEDDIDQLPDIEELIAGLLQTETVSLIFGDSNVGKTFIALHIAQCVARGIPWLGHTVKQGPVLYIYAEGIGVCGVAEQKSGLSYELASQVDWQERKKRRFRSFLLILCFLYIFCLLM